MVVNITGIYEGAASASEIVCRFNGELASYAVFIALISILIVFFAALLYRNQEDYDLAAFISSGLVALVAILAFFIRYDSCPPLLSLKQLSLFLTIFIGSIFLIALNRR